MNWKIESSEIICRLKASENNKIKYFLKNSENGKEYVALHWEGIPCIIYSKEDDIVLDSFNWYYNKHLGYVYTHVPGQSNTTMHSFIMKSQSDFFDNPEKASIDHINYIKTFNVRENLRYATQGDQNSNRDTRKDKIAPPKELMDIGITTLPRYVRYDNSEKKFVIDQKHPALDLIDKSFNYSGTKSCNVSIIYKYYDILKKIEHLNKLSLSPEKLAFLEKQKGLYKEYQDITFLITGETPGMLKYFSDYDYNCLEKYLTPEELEYSRRGLPEKCTINVSDLPEYVCYVKEKGIRGDKFYVSRHHPKLKAAGINDTSTTASKKITIEEKYKQVNKLLEIIDSYQGDELKQALSNYK
jgi:hypothetical protein